MENRKWRTGNDDPEMHCHWLTNKGKNLVKYLFVRTQIHASRRFAHETTQCCLFFSEESRPQTSCEFHCSNGVNITAWGVRTESPTV